MACADGKCSIPCMHAYLDLMKTKYRSTLIELKATEELISSYSHNGNKQLDAAGGTDHDMNLSKEESLQYLSKTFRLPEFTPPYPARVHSREADATKAVHEWLLHHRIDTVFSTQRFKIFLSSPALAARTFPDSSWKGLLLASKFVSCAFLIDDLMDDNIQMERTWEASINFALEVQLVMISTFPDDHTMLECLMEFVNTLPTGQRDAIQNLIQDHLIYTKSERTGQIYSGKLSPVVWAFRDVWVEALAETKSKWNFTFARYYQKCLIASLSQIQNRKSNVVLSLEDFVLFRRDVSAVVCFLVMVDLADDVILPQDIFSSLQMQRLTDLVNDCVSWHNDIWSFKNEYLVRGDVHNLVFLLSHHLNCSFDVSAATVAKILIAQCDEMEVAAKETMEETPPEHQQAVSRYIATCRHWISGTDDWHKNSTMRYL